MNKNLYFKNFGKIFLIMGAVFAVTEIGQASAQWFEGEEFIKCTHSVTLQHQHSKSGWGTDRDIMTCRKWAINIDMLMPHIIARLPAQASANTIINNASPSTFKAKIISSIPNGDQQFKAKVMTLLPLPELAKYYDPNRIFE